MSSIGVVPIAGFCEPLSSWLHLLAAAATLLAAPGLIRAAGRRAVVSASLCVFVFGVFFLFSMSGVYHLLAVGGDAREVLRRLDHAAIWVLIAGTFTPVHVVMFRGPWRWGMLGFIWACAITGLTLKTVFFYELPESVGLILYLGLGWLGAVSGIKLSREYGRQAPLELLIWGGAVYSLGGVLSVVGTPVIVPHFMGHHELFHVFVMGGAYLHWWFIRELIIFRGKLAAEPGELAALARP